MGGTPRNVCTNCVDCHFLLPEVCHAKCEFCFRWLAGCESELEEHYRVIEQDLEKLAATFVDSVEGSEDIMVVLSVHTTNKHQEQTTSPVTGTS